METRGKKSFLWDYVGNSFPWECVGQRGNYWESGDSHGKKKSCGIVWESVGIAGKIVIPREKMLKMLPMGFVFQWDFFSSGSTPPLLW